MTVTVQDIRCAVEGKLGTFPVVERTRQFCVDASRWLMDATPEDVILCSISGSYLYGTAHAGSDIDFVVVCAGLARNKSVKTDMFDMQIVSLVDFVRLVGEGAPQFVEALESPYRVVNMTHPWAPFVCALRPDVGRFRRKCMSAACAYAGRSLRQVNDGGTRKMRRHVARLMDMVSSSWDTGVINPVWRNFGAFSCVEESYFDTVAWQVASCAQ